MADISVPYTLTTPAGTITFNDGSADQFYITGETGLGTAPRRTPIDSVPFGDGALVHTFWKDARQVTIEGVFLVTSVPCGSAMVAIWNAMEEDLNDALESIGGGTDGTLAWTPSGLSARSLSVRHNVPMENPHLENFSLRGFNFGVIAGDPNF
jgi:hypothetical protein